MDIPEIKVEPEEAHSGKSYFSLIILLILSYISFAVWPLTIPVCLLLWVVAFRRSLRAGLICLLFSPLVFIPMISYGSGIVGYGFGVARLTSFGLPGSASAFNLNSEYRYFPTWGG